MATYQRMMNKVFYDEIGDILEVYMDDMIVKSQTETDHAAHLVRRALEKRFCINQLVNEEILPFIIKKEVVLHVHTLHR